MSNLIRLADKKRNSTSKQRPEGATAEIVIFHGVRIERLTDDMIQTSLNRARRLPSLQNSATAEELEKV